MAIKPLEKKTIKGAIPKLIFITVLLIGGLLINKYVSTKTPKINFEGQKPSVLGVARIINNPAKTINDSIKNTSDTTVQVLGSATQLLSSAASDSAALVSNFIFDNTIGRIVEQVEKLSISDQQKIKEVICK